MTELDMDIQIALPHGKSRNREKELMDFAQAITELDKRIGFHISARGWGYELETFRLIDKNQIDLAESLVNEAILKGYVNVDIIAQDQGRAFSGVEVPETCTPIEYLARFLGYCQRIEYGYTPDWWENEEFYVQMLVEKIDLRTLWEPICKQYHIPIATSSGWSSILQRAEFGRRFKEAEQRGLRCVLLYAGDFDPDGVRISDTLRKNLADVRRVVWSDGESGYDPKDLIIERFALNLDQIERLNLLWIDNLKTGSKKKDLADPLHPNFHLDYVQNWLKTIGRRKVESNALVTKPQEARRICEDDIVNGGQNWPGLGKDALERFQTKRTRVTGEIQRFRRKTGLNVTLARLISIIRGED
jgi:hypothetical protein